METSFTDSDGVSWSVREDGADEARSYDNGSQPGTTWLRFESDLEVRRLWHYPDDWRGLSAMQLESLLDRASTVIARFRSARQRSPSADTSPRPGLSSSVEARPSERGNGAPVDPRSRDETVEG